MMLWQVAIDLAVLRTGKQRIEHGFQITLLAAGSFFGPSQACCRKFARSAGFQPARLKESLNFVGKIGLGLLKRSRLQSNLKAITKANEIDNLLFLPSLNIVNVFENDEELAN